MKRDMETVLRVSELLREGLFTDGAHHKQWALRQVAEVMALPVDEWAREFGYEPDDPALEGIAP